MSQDRRIPRRGLIVVALAGSLYLLSTLGFGLIALVIGVRLIVLSVRTGRAPERDLGFGLILTACLGYGTIIGTALARGAGAEGELFTTLAVVGKVLHNAGVMFILMFLVRVFRPGQRWAHALFAALAVILWTGFAGYILEGGAAHGRPEGFWYWLEFSVIGTYPIWGAIESFRYYAQMCRRLDLGLADPLVADRFRLWGLASVGAFLAIWTISLPGIAAAVAGDPAPTQISPTAMLWTAAFGSGTISAYWLTFFPPAWYRALLGAEPSSAS